MDTSLSFFERVFVVVKKIPMGKVTTYGAVAKAIGTKDSRRVGQALHTNHNQEGIHCHRVVFANGRLAPGYAFGGPKEQLRKLQLEGVIFKDNETVDLKSCLYTP